MVENDKETLLELRSRYRSPPEIVVRNVLPYAYSACSVLKLLLYVFEEIRLVPEIAMHITETYIPHTTCDHLRLNVLKSYASWTISHSFFLLVTSYIFDAILSFYMYVGLVGNPRKEYYAFGKSICLIQLLYAIPSYCAYYHYLLFDLSDPLEGLPLVRLSCDGLMLLLKGWFTLTMLCHSEPPYGDDRTEKVTKPFDEEQGADVSEDDAEKTSPVFHSGHRTRGQDLSPPNSNNHSC